MGIEADPGLAALHNKFLQDDKLGAEAQRFFGVSDPNQRLQKNPRIWEKPLKEVIAGDVKFSQQHSLDGHVLLKFEGRADNPENDTESEASDVDDKVRPPESFVVGGDEDDKDVDLDDASSESSDAQKNDAEEQQEPEKPAQQKEEESGHTETDSAAKDA